ncbi:MAG: hypothetical protein R6X03_06000, partial [Methyloceanibacter sp.]
AANSGPNRFHQNRTVSWQMSLRQGKPDIHHHRKPDDRGRTVEIAEGILHRCKLWNTTSRLKLICSDTA